jgi:hypothetical protein
MTTVAELLEDVQGMRDEAARELASRYDSVTELAHAPAAELQEVNGVGPVVAERIRSAAQVETVEAAPAAPTETVEPAPAAPVETADGAAAAAATSQAATATKQPPAPDKRLEVVTAANSEPTTVATGAPNGEATVSTPMPPRTAPGAPGGEPVDTIPPVVEKVASLVGAAAGWTLKLYRTVTRPAHQLVDGLVGLIRR